MKNFYTPVVVGGFCYFPEHPLADLHGIVRFAVKTRSAITAQGHLSRYGVALNPRELNRTWSESKSHVEIEVTGPCYGDVFFCPPGQAYIHSKYYLHDRKWMLAHREEAQRLAQAEGHKVATSPRRGKKAEFP